MHSSLRKPRRVSLHAPHRLPLPNPLRPRPLPALPLDTCSEIQKLAAISQPKKRKFKHNFKVLTYLSGQQNNFLPKAFFYRHYENKIPEQAFRRTKSRSFIADDSYARSF